MSTLSGSQSKHTNICCTYYRSHNLLIQLLMSLLKGSQFYGKTQKHKQIEGGFSLTLLYTYTVKKRAPLAELTNYTRSIADAKGRTPKQTRKGGLTVHVLKTRTTARRWINARVVTWSLKAQPYWSQRILKPSTPPSNFRLKFRRKAHADGTGGSHSVFGNPALTRSQRILKPSTLPQCHNSFNLAT